MSDADDRALRDRWRERSYPGAPSPGCPDPETLRRAVALELPVDERRSLVRHVGGCALCAETWRLAVALGDAPRRIAPAVPRRIGSGTRLALAAACLATVALLGWYAVRREGGREETMRAGEPSVRSVLREGQALPREDFRLRWTPGPEGTIYDVEVATADLRLLSRAMALTSPEYRVPADALEGVPAGTTIAWRVEATLPDGRVVASVTHLTPLR